MGLSPGPELLLKPGNEHNPQGYYEHRPLNLLTRLLLARMGRDFDFRLPASRREFQELKLGGYRRAIRGCVRMFGLEVYKDNRLMLFPDLYAEVFPEAVWIFVDRGAEERFRSRFGKNVHRGEWDEFNAARLKLWKSSPVSRKALHIRYEDFLEDLDAGIGDVAGRLGVAMDMEKLENCRRFFMPRRRPVENEA
jgi:hypothetical protein